MSKKNQTNSSSQQQNARNSVDTTNKSEKQQQSAQNNLETSKKSCK